MRSEKSKKNLMFEVVVEKSRECEKRKASL